MSSNVTLEQRAAELREVVNTPTAREQAARELMEVEAQLAEERRQKELADAKARITGIKRAYPSLLTEYADDAQRVRDAQKQLSRAVEAMNERYKKLLTLEREAVSLGLTELARVELPALALKDEPHPAALLDIPDFARVMREIVEGRANVPEPQVPTRPRPKLTPKEEQEARRMGQAAGAAERALRSIPGGQGL